MLQQKSVKELTEILTSLKAKLERMNPEKKSDKKLFSETDNVILKSNAPEIEKKKWVISKILQFRTDLFAEYLKLIQLSEKNKDLDKTVEYMNEYIISLAVPFIGKVKPPSWSDRFMAFFNRKTVPSPYEYLQQWKTDYQTWFKKNTSLLPEIYENERREKYQQMQIAFNMLYNYSFSRDNVPERQAFVIVDSNKIKM